MQPQQPTLLSVHPAHLDEFTIIRPLGSGLQATVKLASSPTGTLVAIKKYRTQTFKLHLVENQIKIIKNFSHENVIKLIDCRPNAVYTKSDGTKYECCVIILEYAAGGELFDYVADSGRFEEKVARSYFGQLMNGLFHVHQMGFVHRDLKPENLLLSDKYELKIADFGFSTHKGGKMNNGVLRSGLGTPGYMAPQIDAKGEYNGEKIDVFASGVILFIIYSGCQPFKFASAKSQIYRLIIKKDYTRFWNHFQRHKGKIFTPQFKDLIQRMIANDPAQRPTIEQIAAHPWIKGGEIPTLQELKVEFERRQKKVEEAIEKRRVEQEKKKEEAKKQIGEEGQGNMRNSRVTEVDESFVEDVRVERYRKRKLPLVEQVYGSDLVLRQQLPFIIAQLKHFLATLSLNPYTTDLSCPSQSQRLTPSQHLHLSSLSQPAQHEMLAQLAYQHGDDEDEEETFGQERIRVRFVFGRDRRGDVVVRVGSGEEDGDWFWVKRMEREVRRVFAGVVVGE